MDRVQNLGTPGGLKGQGRGAEFIGGIAEPVPYGHPQASATDRGGHGEQIGAALCIAVHSSAMTHYFKKVMGNNLAVALCKFCVPARNKQLQIPSSGVKLLCKLWCCNCNTGHDLHAHMMTPLIPREHETVCELEENYKL